MKLKEILYWNKIWEIKKKLKEIKQDWKIKKWRNVWKYKLPDIDYENLSMKQTIELLELHSIN